MSEKYHLSITKDYLVFSAAHFLTYDGDICERLHGHNYRVTAEIHGPLDENHYVVDFIEFCVFLIYVPKSLYHGPFRRGRPYLHLPSGGNYSGERLWNGTAD